SPNGTSFGSAAGAPARGRLPGLPGPPFSTQRATFARGKGHSAGVARPLKRPRRNARSRAGAESTGRWHCSCIASRARREAGEVAGLLPREERMGGEMARRLEGDSLHAYRRSLAGVRVLDREAERELARRWAAGDQRAGQKLVEACLPF